MTNQQEMKRLRKKAANRKRRIIVDNDGNDAVYLSKEATPEAFLKCRTTDLPGTQVDTVVYAGWDLGGVWSVHRTSVGEVFTCTKEGFSKNVAGALIRQGTDALELTVNFCRKNNIEVFYSKRMNDMHDSYSGSWYHRYVQSKFKTNHPEYIMGTKDNRPKHGGWAALNYGRSEVRDFAFRFVEEVCENYDIDGLMLDFWRGPVLFKRHAMEGKPVGKRELNQMTGLMRRISRMADRVGLKRGRPIPLAVRVPDSVGFCMDVGMDVERWLAEGLVDILVVSGLSRLNPWETSVKLGHKYGVPVYPCLSETRMKGEAGKVRGSLAAYRARAMNVWASGADGVFTFNIPNPRRPQYRQIGDPKTLEGRDKVYTTGARGFFSWLLIDGWERHLGYSPVSPERPRQLDPGKAVRVELPVGENLSKKKGPAPKVQLQLRFKRLAAAKDVAVKLNGNPVRRGSKSGAWVKYALQPRLVRKGANIFEITLKPTSNAGVALLDLLLLVRHGKRA